MTKTAPDAGDEQVILFCPKCWIRIEHRPAGEPPWDHHCGTRLRVQRLKGVYYTDPATGAKATYERLAEVVLEKLQDPTFDYEAALYNARLNDKTIGLAMLMQTVLDIVKKEIPDA